MGILGHAQDVVFPSLASFAQDLSYAAQRRVASCFLFPPYLKGPIASDARQQTYFQYARSHMRDFTRGRSGFGGLPRVRTHQSPNVLSPRFAVQLSVEFMG